MILKAPFVLLPDFLTRFGYHGERRFVALFWEPCGDEACYDDGQSYACGCCDNWLYLDLVRRPDVRAWLDQNDIHLGSSDKTALHWLVVDAGTGQVFAAACQDARAILLRQELPGE
jgi:hypothetical protein